MLRNKERWKDKVVIVKFEDLVTKTKSVMRYLAGFLEIQFDDILVLPTFNKYPINANTSFDSEKAAILTTTLSRYRTLSSEQLELIDEITKDQYQKLMDVAISF
jgi:hypothetical protein